MRKVDIIGETLPEISRFVLMKLPKEDIRHVWNTSRKWRAILSKERFWKRKFLKDFFNEEIKSLQDVEVEQTKIYKEIRKKYLDWQSAYLYSLVLDSNWKRGNCIAREFSGEGYSNCNCVIYPVNQKPLSDLCTVTDTGSVYVTNIATGITKICIPDKNERIIPECISGNLFFAVFLNSELKSEKLKVWNLVTQNMIFHLENFDVDNFGDWCSVSVYNNTFIIINYKGILSYWDSTQFRSVCDNVKCGYLYENFITILTCRGTVEVIKLDDNEYAPFIMNCCDSNKILCAKSEGKYLVSRCDEGHFSTWNIEKRLKLAAMSFDAEFSYIEYFIHYNRIIFFCDTCLRIFEVLTQEHLFDINDNQPFVRVNINSHYIFTSCETIQSFDFIFKMWDIHTGQHVSEFILPLPVPLSNFHFSNTFIVYNGFSNDKTSSIKSYIKVLDFDQPMDVDRHIS